MIVLNCPHCHKKLGVGDALAGRTAVCPQCQNTFLVPEVEMPEAQVQQAVQPAAPPKPPPLRPPPSTTEDELILEEVKPSPKPPPRPIQEVNENELIQEEVKPKRRVPEDELILEEVKPRRRAPDNDLLDEDEPPHPRKKKKKRKKKRRAGGGFPIQDPFLLITLIVGFVAILCIAPAMIAPATLGWTLYIALGMGYLVAFSAAIWILVIAFQDNAVHGVACLIVPIYMPIYALIHWEDCKRPLLLYVIGIAMLIASFCAGGTTGMFNQMAPGASGNPPVNIRSR